MLSPLAVILGDGRVAEDRARPAVAGENRTFRRLTLLDPAHQRGQDVCLDEAFSIMTVRVRPAEGKDSFPPWPKR